MQSWDFGQLSVTLYKLHVTPCPSSKGDTATSTHVVLVVRADLPEVDEGHLHESNGREVDVSTATTTSARNWHCPGKQHQERKLVHDGRTEQILIKTTARGRECTVHCPAPQTVQPVSLSYSYDNHAL